MDQLKVYRDGFQHVTTDFLMSDKSTEGDIYREIYRDKTYDANSVAVEPGDVVVDIGANIGVFTRYALQVRQAAQVWAFEPDMYNYACLVENAPGAKCYNAAVTDNSGIGYFYRTGNIGGHTCFDLGRGDEKTWIPTVNIDEMFCRCWPNGIDFLKLDAEGAEFFVFNSLFDFNLQNIRKISMEYHHFVDEYYPGYYEKLLARLGKFFEIKKFGAGAQTMIQAVRK